jgi:hypothetical protein
MNRTASTPIQALAIPAVAAAFLLLLAGFVSGVDAPRLDSATGSDAPTSIVPSHG